VKARRAELERLTLEKGLKPLCRDYGISATGAKSAVITRLLAHEAGDAAAPAASTAVRAAAPAASSELVQAVRALMGEPRDGAALVTRVEVSEYLSRFARAVEEGYPRQKPPPPGSLFEQRPEMRRAARCVMDAGRGTLRVYAQLLDDDGSVLAERDDTAAFSAALLTQRGAPTAAAKALGSRFRALGKRKAEVRWPPSRELR